MTVRCSLAADLSYKATCYVQLKGCPDPVLEHKGHENAECLLCLAAVFEEHRLEDGAPQRHTSMFRDTRRSHGSCSLSELTPS